MTDHNYFVYFVTNWTGERMYVGVTNDLERRIWEHKNKVFEGHTEKYNLDRLVYFEHGFNITGAIKREKQIKRWRREKKDKLVEIDNPNWDDLAAAWYKGPSAPRALQAQSVGMTGKVNEKGSTHDHESCN